MWKPTSVVPEHRRRATGIWGALLLAIVGYTIWQAVNISHRYNDPNTNFSVSDDDYNFPILDVCFWGGHGCDENREDADCIASATVWVGDPCFDEVVEDVQTTSKGTNCLALDLRSVDLQGFRDGCDGITLSKKPSMNVVISWISSVAPDEEVLYRESVTVFLGNETNPEYVTVPYTRIVLTPDIDQEGLAYTETDMTIGKSTRNTFDGDSNTSYPILAYSTGNYVDRSWTGFGIDPNGDGSSYAVGYVDLTLTQGGYSQTELTDIHPLDMASLLGNIGGFWELLLVIWGVCFIAARTEDPTHKGRDFKEPIQRGKSFVNRKRRRANPTTVTPNSEGNDDERPYWSATGTGPQEANGGSVLVIPPVGARPPMIIAPPSFRRPIPQDHPRRLSSTSIRPVVTSESSLTTRDSASPNQPIEPLGSVDCV